MYIYMHVYMYLLLSAPCVPGPHLSCCQLAVPEGYIYDMGCHHKIIGGHERFGVLSDEVEDGRDGFTLSTA